MDRASELLCSGRECPARFSAFFDAAPLDAAAYPGVKRSKMFTKVNRIVKTNIA
jgi:hypothetical protein